MEYINQLGRDDDSCFLCRCRDQVDQDEQNLLLWRGATTLAMLNLFPYTGGHCLVAPYDHVGSLEKLSPATLAEMMEMVRDLQRALQEAIHPQGFNVGINIGHCAGAGLPDHIHMHIVPRWNGDTNFMPVFGKVRVIPDTLANIRREILTAADSLDLPNLSAAEQ